MLTALACESSVCFCFDFICACLATFCFFVAQSLVLRLSIAVVFVQLLLLLLLLLQGYSLGKHVSCVRSHTHTATMYKHMQKKHSMRSKLYAYNT